MHQLVPPDARSAVLLLHGLGADGADLISLGGALRRVLPKTAFFAPDAPQPCDMAPFGFQWFSLRDRSMASVVQGLAGARPGLDAMIDKILSELSLPPEKFVLGGFSQGAMLALYAGLQREKPLAGILAFSGGLFGFGPAADKAARIASKPPVQLVHGLQDEVVPVDATRAAHETLKAAGVPAQCALLDGLGHGIDDRGLDLAAKFLQPLLHA